MEVVYCRKDYILVNGPNTENCLGPNSEFHQGPCGAMGPDPSLRHGPQSG